MDQISTDCRPLSGVLYTEFLGRLATFVKPTSYFEIGTNTGSSLDKFSCDAVCVDPAFVLEGNHVGKKRESAKPSFCGNGCDKVARRQS